MKMKKVVLVFILVLAFVVSFSETVSFTRYQSGLTPVYETLDWTGGTLKSVSIPQFNSSLGTLTKAELTIQYDISQDIEVENTNDSGVNILVQGQCIATWSSLPNNLNNKVFTTATNNVSYDYDAYDGVEDYTGPSGRTFLDVTDSQSANYSFEIDLTSFIGSGNIDMNVGTFSGSSVFGATNISVVLASEALATATITYTYDAEETLPVELASFTAITTSDNFARINWATHTETGLLGFNIYRNETDNLDSSLKINLSPINPSNSSEYQSYSYTDNEVEGNTTYYYWLESQELSNISEIFGPVIVTIQAAGEDVEDVVVENLAGIKSIYPNPFNPETTIRYYLNSESNVQFEVYNLLGQRIHSSDLGSKSGNQYHSVVWNGKDDENNTCSSGTYFFKIKSNNFTQTSKAVLSK